MTFNALALFASTFMILACAGAQSLFVNNGRYAGAFFACFAATASNFVLFKLAPGASPVEMAAFCMGGPCGLMLAMYFFRHLHAKRVAGKE